MAMSHGHGRAGRRRDDQVVWGDRVQGGLHEVILCNLSFVNSHRSPTVIGHTILINFTLIKIKNTYLNFPTGHLSLRPLYETTHNRVLRGANPYN